MESNLEFSDYFTIVVISPESHAELIRQVIGRLGAGRFKNYTFCSHSTKGISRFTPDEVARCRLDLQKPNSRVTQSALEAVYTKECVEIEERIEAICHQSCIVEVLEEIKKLHPYRETIIQVYRLHQIGFKSEINEK